MVKRVGLYPGVQVDTGGTGVVSQGGGAALVEAVRVGSGAFDGVVAVA
jgi:hypothetical protein